MQNILHKKQGVLLYIGGRIVDHIMNVLEYYAQCNKLINKNMLKIVHENTIFNKNITGYYKSINEILFHILTVDLSWTNDLKEIKYSEIFEEQLYKNFDENNDISPYKSITDFEYDRITLDELIIKFVKELNEKDMEKTIVYKNNIPKTTWEILIHMFNHQTHHRGEISQILDESGIDNDFSNMIRYNKGEWK